MVLIFSAWLLVLSGCQQKEDRLPEEEVEESVEEKVEEETTKENQEEDLQDYIDLELYNEKGELVKISDYEGKFIALKFFGTWCKYCMEEMPVFEKIYKEYPKDDLVILLVNATTTEQIDAEAVVSWYEKEGYTMPMMMDLEGEALATYPVQGFPTTYFISKTGKVL